jgi:hypothetical protein
LDALPGSLLAIQDGLSNTALYSERLVGAAPPASLRNTLAVTIEPLLIGPACIQAQLGTDGLSDGDPFAGASWLKGGQRHTRYSHLLPPNSKYQDCTLSGWQGLALMTARSAHVGGVNLLCCDGHVVFIGDQVSVAVWRALGTPNGNEVVELP